MADVPVVMAVFLQYVEGSRSVGVAYCDATGRKLGACQFTDDEHFCNLETVLVQLGAKECVLPKVRASCYKFYMSCLKSAPSVAQAAHTIAERVVYTQQVQACWLQVTVCISSVGTVYCIRPGSAVRQGAIAKS